MNYDGRMKTSLELNSTTYNTIIMSFLIAKGGGRRGSPKTVKPPKDLRKTVKPSQNSAKTVTTFLRALHVRGMYRLGSVLQTTASLSFL